MIIKFSEINSSLGTRKLGKEIRHNMISQIQSNEIIIFDFENVDLISNSFADECFAKLLEVFSLEIIKKKTTFKNANNDISMVIKKAFNDRIKKITTV